MSLLFRYQITVDPEDQHIVDKHDWYLTDKGYARTRLPDGKQIHLHELILDTDKLVDHRNGIKLDCRRSNLREATNAQNLQNRGKNITNLRRFKGVYPVPKGKFVAKICANNVKYHLGTFDTEEQAALAYNEAALKYHGEFAYLNKL